LQEKAIFLSISPFEYRHLFNCAPNFSGGFIMVKISVNYFNPDAPEDNFIPAPKNMLVPVGGKEHSRFFRLKRFFAF
jgi:hypothetical protein